MPKCEKSNHEPVAEFFISFCSTSFTSNLFSFFHFQGEHTVFACTKLKNLYFAFNDFILFARFTKFSRYAILKFLKAENGLQSKLKSTEKYNARYPISNFFFPLCFRTFVTRKNIIYERYRLLIKSLKFLKFKNFVGKKSILFTHLMYVFLKYL